MASLKYSRQRESIKNFLLSRYDHPTADTIYMNVREEFPNISLGTVYRNLALLTELGEVVKITSAEGADRFDGHVEPHSHFICKKIKVQENKEGIAQNAMSVITDGIEVYIPFEELVDIEEEHKRLEEEKKKVLSEIERATKMLSNPGFVNKAPETKINEEKAKLAKYQEMLKSIEERLK